MRAANFFVLPVYVSMIFAVDSNRTNVSGCGARCDASRRCWHDAAGARWRSARRGGWSEPMPGAPNGQPPALPPMERADNPLITAGRPTIML